MTQRFTSGGSGKFSFDIANDLLDSVAELKGQPPPEDKATPRRADQSIVAQLEAIVDTVTVAGQPLNVWRWKAQELRQDLKTDPRYVTERPNLSTSTFGPPPNGYAIQLSGSAAPLDLAILEPMHTFGGTTNERWFCFQGTSDPISSGLLTMLKVLGTVFSFGSDRWAYEMLVGRYRAPSSPNGYPIFEATSQQPVYGLNLYEASNFYAQPMTHPEGRLEVAGPIPGGSVVLGTFQYRNSTGTPIYAFMAPLPLRAVCNAPLMLTMRGAGEDRMLRDGM